MGIVAALLLGVLQGLTEFLPVSSSGHLALARHIFGIESPGVTFEVFVHFGTALAVIVVFRKRVVSIVAAVIRACLSWLSRRTASAVSDDARLGLHLLVGTIPAAFVGYFLADRVEAAFDNPIVVSAMLIVTGFILWATRRMRAGSKSRESLLDAVKIGLAQAAAIIPGISRSGSTISAGLASGLTRERAAEFAFLLSIPVILGATAASMGEALGARGAVGPALIVGAVAAFLSAIPAIKILIRAVTSGRMYRFAVYCWIVGGVGLIAFLVRR